MLTFFGIPVQGAEQRGNSSPLNGKVTFFELLPSEGGGSQDQQFTAEGVSPFSRKPVMDHSP